MNSESYTFLMTNITELRERVSVTWAKFRRSSCPVTTTARAARSDVDVASGHWPVEAIKRRTHNELRCAWMGFKPEDRLSASIATL